MAGLDVLVLARLFGWIIFSVLAMRLLWTYATSPAGDATTVATLKMLGWYVMTVRKHTVIASKTITDFWLNFFVDVGIGIPSDIQLLASTTTTLTIGWTVSDSIIISSRSHSYHAQ